MVKKVNKINKKQFESKQNKSIFVIAGIAIALVVGIAFYPGGQGESNAIVGPAPAGNNCPENVAYIQTGVNKFSELFGQFPTDVNQLLQEVDGKPIVEEVPPCPSGNLYVIDNGIVKEVPKQ